ncbi:MAG: histidine phosphatase family protein [Chloroflexota bacterium]|nr:histidine phosphatase family protein [Chloroflexota bacterium]
MTYILLLRHGQNDLVEKHQLAGWLPNVHLNATGQEQATALAARLAHLTLTALYSSPLSRCLETAGPIAQGHNLAIQEVPELGEVRYGDWEGQKTDELAKLPAWQQVQHFPSRLRFPQGEALREVQFRAVQALEQLAAQQPKAIIAVVSHADLIKLLLAHYLGVHIDLFQRIVIAPASASVLDLTDTGTVRILRINDDGPLVLTFPPAEAAPAAAEPPATP